MQFADNEDLQSMWKEVKRINKLKVVSFLREKTGYLVSPDAMFDVQVIFCPWIVNFIDKDFNNFCFLKQKLMRLKFLFFSFVLRPKRQGTLSSFISTTFPIKLSLLIYF